jgi:hypothetical protein
MARYNLIIRDATYLKLLQEAARMGKTMGKFLNEILDKVVENCDCDGHLAANPVCIVCGQKASLELHGLGQQKFFVCSLHKRNIADLSYKVLP